MDLKLPKHLGIIMDGNGRWAKQRGLKRYKGHQEGVNVFKEIIKESFKLGIKYISVYAFSVDNWKRDQEEINFLMKMIIKFYDTDFPYLKNNNIRVLQSGITSNLNEEIIQIIRKIEKETEKNNGGVLNICFNYSGQLEILDAAKKIAKEYNEKKIDIENMTINDFKKYLYHDLPDIDLLIRTSGELRISDFMLYRIAYSELWFTDKLWPDFTKDDLYKAIEDFSKRERRFGSA
ncbi:MAG TPA: polyprenyl diphosphate synthase [Spirochaetota bacterium]|nr:polyprenyl diphosphate synthase [Spirochaetota bacterium]HOM39195.1 polyprenyl diphosphate synthase [Spirochaetota bacterium]HPQ49230.1 polyprenyl diphosphate synthase [Spirochaetota bacterium]